MPIMFCLILNRYGGTCPSAVMVLGLFSPYRIINEQVRPT